MFRFTSEQLIVHIGNISRCRVLPLTSSNTAECIPIDANYPVDMDIPMTVQSAVDRTDFIMFFLKVQLGHQMTTLGNIRFRDEDEVDTKTIIIAVAVSISVFILIVLIFAIILSCFWRNSRRKDQKLDELQMTLSKLETNVAHECKEG